MLQKQRVARTRSLQQQPPPPPPPPKRKTSDCDVVLDMESSSPPPVAATDDAILLAAASAPTPGRKTVYNPHRVLHAVVWVNFALLLLLGALFATYVLTRPPLPLLPSSSQLAARVASSSSEAVVNRIIYFAPPGAGAQEVILELPAGQFNFARFLDAHVCCSSGGSSGSFACLDASDITISHGGGSVRIQGIPPDATECRLAWLQQQQQQQK